MTTITYSIDNLRVGRIPLYSHYPLQILPQPAYVELNEHGEVTADYSGEIGNGVPAYVWNGRTRRYAVSPYASGEALADLLQSDKCRALLERIHTGHDVEWDGSNYAGRLDDDAQSAEDKLERLLETVDEVEVWGAAEWIGDCPIDELWPAGKTLAEAAADIGAAPAATVIEGDVADAIAEKAARNPESLTPDQRAELRACGWTIDEDDE